MSELLLALALLLGTNFADGTPIEDPLPAPQQFNGHTTDYETQVICHVLWDEPHRDDCERVALCESGSDPKATGRNGDGTLDLGRWQHNSRYIDARLAAIFMPDGDPYDLMTNGLLTRWYWGRLGGTFGTTAGWHCAPRVGAR